MFSDKILSGLWLMHENKFSVLILNTVNLYLGAIIILFFFG